MRLSCQVVAMGNLLPSQQPLVRPAPTSVHNNTHEASLMPHRSRLPPLHPGVALAAGLNWYLKYSCGAEVSWGRDGTGDQLALPAQLPAVQGGTVHIDSPVQWRYTWNVCTFSYSMSFWDWER